MAMGPVQVLVVGFGPDAEFKGEALDQLRLLREQDIVRVIDLLVVHHKEDGTVEKLEIADHEELADLGALAGALIGFGAAGEEGAEVGAEAGAASAAGGGACWYCCWSCCACRSAICAFWSASRCWLSVRFLPA